MCAASLLQPMRVCRLPFYVRCRFPSLGCFFLLLILFPSWCMLDQVHDSLIFNKSLLEYNMVHVFCLFLVHTLLYADHWVGWLTGVTTDALILSAMCASMWRGHQMIQGLLSQHMRENTTMICQSLKVQNQLLLILTQYLLVANPSRNTIQGMKMIFRYVTLQSMS